MRAIGTWIAAAVIMMALHANAQTSTAFREEPSRYWNFEELQKAPQYRDAGFADSESAGLQAILFDGVAIKGKQVPVFAYIGLPDSPPPEGGYPGMVMVHGGTGTAYPAYVKLWNSYGYAVIALDWYNMRPVISVPPGKEDAKDVGKAPLPGGYRKPDSDAEHIDNVSNMVLANSLLRSLPNVNKDRIGFMGLSWGSWYGAIVAAVDCRFKCCIEVYCGDCWPEKYLVDKRHALTNGRFLHAAKVPMYWIAGTNDQNVTPESLQRGWDECATIENKSLVINFGHSADHGWRLKAAHRMADHFLKGSTALPKLGKPVLKDNRLSADILHEGKGINKAVLCYSVDRAEQTTHQRVWATVPAIIRGKQVSAQLPPGTFQCFLSVYDEESPHDDCCGSSDLVVVE